MISEIYWINEEKIGDKKIGTMARPRGNDWLDDEIKWLKIRKVTCLVSLLENSEEWELGLQKEREVCTNWGIEFINFPIKDINTPKNENEFILLVNKLANRIRENKKVVIHCRMGIGRSSILAAAIMINLGFEGKDIFEIIGKYRKLKVPDTEEQKKWILSIEEKLKKEEISELYKEMTKEQYLNSIKEEIDFFNESAQSIKEQQRTNKYFPCTLASFEQTNRVTIDSINGGVYFELLANFFLYGNGYCWEGLVEQYLEEVNPKLLRRINFDSEGEAFVAYCESTRDMEELGGLIHDLCVNEEKFRSFLDTIDRDRIDD